MCCDSQFCIQVYHQGILNGLHVVVCYPVATQPLSEHLHGHQLVSVRLQ